MFSSVVAVVALVVFVLPGFLTLRISRGRRAAPAGFGDLELVLRALGFSLVLHTLLALTGLTARVVRSVDAGREWMDHTWLLAGFSAATIAGAVALGLLVHRVLEHWQGMAGWRQALFHALGGEDARDAFDYIFERRKSEEDFLVLLTVEGPDGPEHHAGRYGSKSFFGLSPRPHDLYLEELWDRSANGRLTKREPAEEGWFAASKITMITFREKPVSGIRLGRFSIEDAIRQERRYVARQIVRRAEDLGYERSQANELLGARRDELAKAIEAVSHAEGGDAYRAWHSIASDLVEFAALVATTADFHEITERMIASAISQGLLHTRLDHGPRKAWWCVLDHYLAQVQDNGDTWAAQHVLALVAQEILSIWDADWDLDEA